MKVYLQMITKQLFEWNITYKWSLEIISAFINPALNIPNQRVVPKWQWGLEKDLSN